MLIGLSAMHKYALKTQDLSSTYLAHHDLESVLIITMSALPSLTHELGFRAGQSRAREVQPGCSV